VAASNADSRVFDLLADSYVTIIVVIAVVIIVMVLVVALAVYKNYRTWASTRTTRRRHSSQHEWLYPDNPEMWDETLDGDGELPKLSYTCRLTHEDRRSIGFIFRPAKIFGNISVHATGTKNCLAPSAQVACKLRLVDGYIFSVRLRMYTLWNKKNCTTLFLQ